MVEHVLNYVEKDGNFDSIYLWVVPSITNNTICGEIVGPSKKMLFAILPLVAIQFAVG